MEIKYLKKMKDTPKIGQWVNRGISEQKIEKLEQEFNISFPQAYKEFLYLGGDFQNCVEWSTNYEYLDWRQDNIKESMASVNLHLKPFFAFADFEGHNCLFFFLGDGDNPPVYGYDESKIYTNDKGEEVYYKRTDNSFSECIDSFVNYSLKNK
ncbi:SMI1/KNR4 family protein [Elizabethkingia anophelis]|uniref:SMI1 / KNR4 family n=1 Tax=Elizabethkingia anophelis TaxID=1117645 RepID=A0A7Z7PYA9_9FLAO|nr:SMI1/KNR4 family protein [Elizabethkingia anophelis]MCT3631200.1 SMI1/KNR4 family protein [Elizabethkingia anophelis]MCT3634706.1 SMI1/KNR4 family protein [Elizabethkingia anophelis]MCT3831441.1 SMI1/KNR4 family protein [Elizabethkingia anophelis]MCT3884919.1 SMI1/KNR4 family protein [Elizabethkingia anophelis]MCT3895677.1 SMI1/KNR4 family protein [Elizabethkingia anophelis]